MAKSNRTTPALSKSAKAKPRAAKATQAKPAPAKAKSAPAKAKSAPAKAKSAPAKAAPAKAKPAPTKAKPAATKAKAAPAKAKAAVKPNAAPARAEGGKPKPAKAKANAAKTKANAAADKTQSAGAKAPRKAPKRAPSEQIEPSSVERSAEQPLLEPVELESAPTPVDLETPPEQSLADTTAFLKGLIEAILFVSDRPLSLKELARAAKLDKKRTGELVAELGQDYAGRGFGLSEVAGGLALRTSAMYANYVRNFLSQRPVRLSRPQLETLAIIAYRQPITRPEVDEIRGVDSGPVLKGLLERDLIKILGKKDEAGRPMLYGTTDAFLELFSMESLRELPTLKEFTELSDESRQVFERQIGEEAPEGSLEAPAPAEAGAAAPDEFGRAMSDAEEPGPSQQAPDEDHSARETLPDGSMQVEGDPEAVDEGWSLPDENGSSAG